MRINTSKWPLLLQIIVFLVFLTDSYYSQTFKDSGSWEKYDIHVLSFSAPSDLSSKPYKGIDSDIWKYVSPDLELIIDLGLYSEKPETLKLYGGYTEKSVIVDGSKAEMVFFELKESDPRNLKYGAAIYFTQIGSCNEKLSFVAFCKTPEGQKTAEKIFGSIKFKS